ncbi:ArdC family protein [Cytobacillus solani]|uniref:ArdC family protein n=1 Tax=Cytobacillus solani TaxID=1637975 RepID=UPI0006ABCA0B|nr:zincin-like metallopeptidase domain-containing protein [Cytobacillus solani]KOP81355.1 antirestriction protein [Bacillus sp. FJAT-21945]
MNVYEIVTQKIIEKLEAGVIPWRKPWINVNAVNWLTQKPYRGINTMLLEPGEYATFKQIKDAGGRVKDGAKSEIVVFWKWIEKEIKETGEIEKIPLLKCYRVFNISTQVEGLNSKREIKAFDNDPIEEAEKVFKSYINCPSYSYNSGKAYYQPSIDHINCPPMKDFPNVNEYYSTLFHEMVHSTGHKSRLNRSGIIEMASFGDEVYSKEELVAEMGATMLCGIAGIDNSTLPNSASYIASWLKKLNNDKSLVVKAAAQAQKAADYILGKEYKESAE